MELRICWVFPIAFAQASIGFLHEFKSLCLSNNTLFVGFPPSTGGLSELNVGLLVRCGFGSFADGFPGSFFRLLLPLRNFMAVGVGVLRPLGAYVG